MRATNQWSSMSAAKQSTYKSSTNRPRIDKSFDVFPNFVSLITPRSCTHRNALLNFSYPNRSPLTYALVQKKQSIFICIQVYIKPGCISINSKTLTYVVTTRGWDMQFDSVLFTINTLRVFYVSGHKRVRAGEVFIAIHGNKQLIITIIYAYALPASNVSSHTYILSGREILPWLV